ncbi:MAG TPA: Fic family protein [Kiritimatiellia bacterium]|nr:Fic family protein [Kiritimatiellia bacterium]
MGDVHHKDLADALERATKVAPRGVVKSAKVRRADRELLLRAGYLQDIVKGWYFLVRPGTAGGESTAWYASFWSFVATYLGERFADDYCLSAVASLELHVGAVTVPSQVVAMTAHGGKTLLNLPHATSVLVYQDARGLPSDVETLDGVRVMPLARALCRLPPAYFHAQPINAELALRAMGDPSALVRIILEERSPTLAGRFVGAYTFIGDDSTAQEIVAATRSLGLAYRPENPFNRPQPALAAGPRILSASAGRIQALFRAMSKPVAAVFKGVKPRPVRDVDLCLRRIDNVYVNDAYNSLSIEGYQVSPELIQRIREGQWAPDMDPSDRGARDAMAAKGYLDAFRRVRSCIRDVMKGADASAVARVEYQNWYRALFSESVKAGLLDAHRLAGHRNGPVYIRNSKHVPPRATVVADCMEALFDCLQAEKNPVVRGVLGHFFMGFIHPYFDGNGRSARFLMNFFLSSAGYTWTIVRNERRDAYLAALERASVHGEIEPFARFLREEMAVDWRLAAGKGTRRRASRR